MDLSPLEDHLTAPRGHGRLAQALHQGTAGGAACGDLIRIAVEVDGDRVAEAGFDAGGCAAARAAGSAVVELVRGTPLLEATRIGPPQIAEALGGLSPERAHAAELASDALHRALGKAARAGAARLAPSDNRVLVAMSGGVDSAVAAQLAKTAGHDVLAVTLELWSEPGVDGTDSCCSPQAVTQARSLAQGIGLPHVTLDVRDGFKTNVVDDFVIEHARGRTPNPCVRCNGIVRFDAMLTLATHLGAKKLATGHYARIANGLLRTAADDNKDQSYMLARLEPHDLDRLWFPLGDLSKPQVRAIAEDAGLPVARKPESQDLCFLAGTRHDDFLKRHGLDAKPGVIVDEQGTVLKQHDGQHRFTVGQRRGIGVATAEPLYVIDKQEARVIVGPKRHLATTSVSVPGAILHRDASEVDRVKLRYRSDPVACRLHGDTIVLDEPAIGVAPGQTACFMRGDQVIGWGTIAPAARAATTPTRESELAHAP